MGQDRCHPVPGDLIEIDRCLYQHWALYMGDGYVIHLTSLDKRGLSEFTNLAKVKKELLKEVVEDDEWRVNNKYDRYRTPFSVKEIIQRAEQWIDKEVPYDVVFKNCEHFVTMLRYGEAVSDQVKKILSAAAGAALAIVTTLAGIILFRKKKTCK